MGLQAEKVADGRHAQTCKWPGKGDVRIMFEILGNAAERPTS